MSPITKISLISFAIAMLMLFWWLFELMRALASIAGGSTGKHPFADFVIERFWKFALAFFLIGLALLVWDKLPFNLQLMK